MSSQAARLAEAIRDFQEQFLEVEEDWVEDHADGFTYWPASMPQYFACSELHDGAMRWTLDMPLVDHVTKPEDAMWLCLWLNTYAAGWSFHFDEASRTLSARAAAHVPEGWDRLLVRFALASTLAAWFCEQALGLLVEVTGGISASSDDEASAAWDKEADSALYLPTVLRERPDWVLNTLSEMYPPLEEVANYAFHSMGAEGLTCEMADDHFVLDRSGEDGSLRHRVRAGFSVHPLFGVGWRTDVVLPIDWDAGFNISAVMETIDRMIADPEAQVLGSWVITAEAVVYQSWAIAHELRSYERMPSFAGHDVHPLWGATSQSFHALLHDPRVSDIAYTGLVGHSEDYEQGYLGILRALRSGADEMFPAPALAGGRAMRDFLWWVERELLVVLGWFNPMGPTVSTLEIREHPETGANHLVALHRHPVVPRYEDLGPCDGEAWGDALSAGMASLCVGSIPHMASLEFCPQELRDDVVAALAEAMDSNVQETGQSYPDAADQIRENMGEPWALAGDQRYSDYVGEIEALPVITPEADVYIWLGMAAHPLNTSSFWRHVPNAWDGSLNHLAGGHSLNRGLLDVGPLLVTYSNLGRPAEEEQSESEQLRKPSFVPDFSTGLARARRLRRHILEQLGASPEWVVGGDADTIIRWVAGPLDTRFSVTQAHDNVPGLGLLRVATALAHVTDLAEARKFVEESNHTATLSRWQLVGDPGGPVGRVPRDAVIHVELTCSVVVGREEREMPTVATILAVGEQIAEASVTASRGIEWGLIAHGAGANGEQREGEWDRAVWFLADQLDPHSNEAPDKLLAAAVEGFQMAIEEQVDSGAGTWWGDHNENSAAFMVPYGEGPYPDGMVGHGADNPVSDGESSSALVNVLPWSNGRSGRGLLIGMRLPFTPISPALPWMVSRLNGQSSYSGQSRAPGFAHGVGSWVERSGETNYTCLIPSYWQEMLSPDDLRRLFKVLFENCARLSWDAGFVLGDPRRNSFAHSHAEMRGLIAGANAGGVLFGEDGKGTEPGAQAVDFVWRNLVVDEPQWAWDYTDGSGFRYWMGPATVDITQTPCHCPHEEGSLVKVRTDLCRDTPQMRTKLRRLQEDGVPMSFGVEENVLYATTQLHLHADSVKWGERWTVPLAVAQVLIAEHLGTASERGLDLATPEGEIRSERDEMLTLWDDRSAWTVQRLADPDVTVLLHALSCAFEKIYGVHLESDGRLFVEWLMTYRDQGGAIRSDEIGTSFGFVDHPRYGWSIRLQTQFMFSWADASVDAALLNSDPDFPGDTFLLGGFHLIDGGIACTHLYPLALDRGELHLDFVSFAGTALNHHLSTAAQGLWVTEVKRDGGFDAKAVAQGVESMTHVYRREGGASRALRVETNAEDPRFVEIKWSRPWAAMDEKEWPRFGARVATEGRGTELRGSVLVQAFYPSPTALKLVHCALATSARPNQRWGADRALLAGIAAMPRDRDFHVARTLLVDRGVLQEEMDGRHLIHDQGRAIGEVSMYRTADHPAWGQAVVIDVELRQEFAGQWRELGARPYLSLDVGEWLEGEASLNYRVCLPPYLFVTLSPTAGRQLLIDLLGSIAEGMRGVDPRDM